MKILITPERKHAMTDRAQKTLAAYSRISTEEGHRSAPPEVISCLLVDIILYCEDSGVDFDRALHRALLKV